MYEFAHTPKLEFGYSRMRERLYKHPPPMLLRQVIKQQKLWPGMRSFWRERNSGLGAHNYTYDDFVQRRRRYAQRDVVFAGEGFTPPFDPVSYSATDTILNLGDGNTPNTTGYPASFTNGVPTGDDQTFNKSAPLLAPGTQTLTFDSDTAFSMAEGFGRNSTEVELTNEVTFAPYLLEMATRLQARSFTETGSLWWPQDIYNEAEFPAGPFSPLMVELYKEWYGGYDSNIPEPEDVTYYTGATSRTNQDGTVGIIDGGPTRYSPSLPLDIDTRPFQGSASDPLHSFWIYPEYLELSGEVQNELRVVAFRTRFKLKNYSSSVDYFIARGVVYTDATYPPFAVSLKLHPVCQLISEGTLAPDTPLELPLPYGPGAEWKDFMQIGANHSSCGAVAFCILKESKTDWSTRTGVKFVGTADSLITTVDDDTTTVDTDTPI